MNVEVGQIHDIDSWMQVVKHVRHSFPGLETPESLEEHRKTVLRFMEEKRALCVKEGQNIVGVLLYSLRHNMICCLAVSKEYRRRGIASILLAEALKHLDHEQRITVTTFRQEDPLGIAPRALYARFGFVPEDLIVELGYPCQRFVLHPMGEETCSDDPKPMGVKSAVFGEKDETKTYVERKGAYLIAMQDGKIAVVKTGKGYFLPGGGLEDGESHWECIERECLEETGCSTRIDTYIGCAEMYGFHERIGYFHPIQYYYAGQILERKKEPIERDHVLQWIDAFSAVQGLHMQGQRWGVELFLHGLKDPA